MNETCHIDSKRDCHLVPARYDAYRAGAKNTRRRRNDSVYPQSQLPRLLILHSKSGISSQPSSRRYCFLACLLPSTRALSALAFSSCFVSSANAFLAVSSCCSVNLVSSASSPSASARQWYSSVSTATAER